MNAIIYLLNNTAEDINTFNDSFHKLCINYLSNFPCTVICFHESDFPQEEINRIKMLYNDIIFYKIDFSIPDYSDDIKSKILDYFPHPELHWRQNGHPGIPMGYRHMCDFFAGKIFSLDIIKNYEYIWRLDTDSFIEDKINYNVFDRMKMNNSVYGYINIQHDHPGAIVNLWNTATEYLKNTNPLVDINDSFHKNRVFYTNFEILNVKWFCDKQYQDFYNHLKNTGGIYIHRWGDHAIRYIALNAFCEQNRLLFFDDIKYNHGGLYHNTRVIDRYQKNSQKIYFLTYANEKFLHRQNELNVVAKPLFDGIFSFTDKDIKNNAFFDENKEILTQTRGAGYWLWKPYLILEALKNVEYDDIVFYMDCGDEIVNNSICSFLKSYLNIVDIMLATRGYDRNSFLTKRDCFVLMGCDDSKYHNGIQIEAGTIGVKKTDFSIKIINEWLFYCKNKNILTDLPNICNLPNFTPFKDHRHDQSVLTNITIKHSLPSTSQIYNYVHGNVYIPQKNVYIPQKNKNGIKQSINLTIHNKDYLIPNLLNAIVKNTIGSYEIIIVLDGCNDMSEEKVFEFFKSHTEISHKILYAPNVFETKANNIAAKNSDGDYIFIIQDDMVIDEYGWNKRMLKPFEMFSDVFSVTSNVSHNYIINPNCKYLDSSPPLGQWSDIFTCVNQTNRQNTNRTVFTVRDTSNRGPLVINHSDFEILGYFDEAFSPQDMDDHDLHYRMKKTLGKVTGLYWINYISDLRWGGTRDENCHVKQWLLNSNYKNQKIMLDRHRDLFGVKTCESRNVF